MKFADARQFAFAAGATDDEIERHAITQMASVGTTPFNNMLVALQLHPWSNSRDEWARLAGGMKARMKVRAMDRQNGRRRRARR